MRNTACHLTVFYDQFTAVIDFPTAERRCREVLHTEKNSSWTLIQLSSQSIPHERFSVIVIMLRTIISHDEYIKMVDEKHGPW